MTIACVQPTAAHAANNKAGSGAESAGQTSTMIAPNQKNQDGNVPNFNIAACVSENIAEPNNLVAEADEVRENLCESMTGDGNDNNGRRGPQQPNEQAAFWASLQRAVANNQESMTGHSNPVPNAELITANLLHNFFAEHQVQHGPISGDNSEFVSLERLAVQNQQTRYEMSNAEVTTPMEQLAQQVHRMSNPTPQINVIPQRHLQAPPPLHTTGVPLSQASTPYHGVVHMQPPMGPPPLFQGFSMFSNQVFPQPGPSQVLPRPPALQQCPQLQAGVYQSVAQTQLLPNLPASQPAAATAAAAAAKRNMPASLPVPESLAPKQRRTSVVKGKSQLSKGKAKGKAPVKPPTSTTRAPPRRTMDPQLVASILAARGITITATPPRENTTQRTPPATATQRTPPATATQRSQPATATQRTPPATATQRSQPATATQRSQPANVTPRSQPATATQRSQPANVTPRTPPASVAQRSQPASVTQRSQLANLAQRTQPKTNPSSPVLNISSAITITPSSSQRTKSEKKTSENKTTENAAASTSRRDSAPIIVNNDIERPERCATVDLTDDDEQTDLYAPGPSVNRFVCNKCGKAFPTSLSLTGHFRVCTAAVSSSLTCTLCCNKFLVEEDYIRHQNDKHKYKSKGPNWVIPVIDLDFPGAEERLLEIGITNYIPISLGDDDGNLAVPLVNQQTPRRQRQFVGMSNAIVLGPVCSLLRRRRNNSNNNNDDEDDEDDDSNEEN